MDGIARRSTPQLTLIGQPYRYLGYSNNKVDRFAGGDAVATGNNGQRVCWRP